MLQKTCCLKKKLWVQEMETHVSNLTIPKNATMGREVKVLSDRVDAISRDLDRVKVKHLEHQEDNIATKTRKLKRNDGKARFPREKPGVEDGEKRNSVKLISKTCVAEFILPDSGLRRFRNFAFRLKKKMRVTGAGVTRKMVAEVMKLKVEGSGVLNMKRMDEIFKRIS